MLNRLLSRVTVSVVLAVSWHCARASAVGANSALDAASDMESGVGDLTLEQLMQEPVTSVSKKATKLNESAAAIAVVTQDDIRRLGITNLPDALRLVPGLEVARISANTWAVSARGFNDQFSGKLLVLVDGRSVYSPSSAGVFWDSQDLMMEDIDRIEVIRGPGATLWGANAVNGVVNVITKRAQDSQGGLVAASAGSANDAQISARYGDFIGPDVSFRIYAKYLEQGSFDADSGKVDTGDWHTLRTGFRTDIQSSSRDRLTVQGDAYAGDASDIRPSVSLSPPAVTTDLAVGHNSGSNLTASWTHSYSDGSALTLQSYLDQAVQGDDLGDEHHMIYDVDVQHRFTFWGVNDVVWGGGYRFASVDDDAHSDDIVWATPHEDIRWINVFAQDEITVVPEHLRVTLGAKFDHSSLAGGDVEPNIRAAWTATDNQTIWAAISRAVDTPSLLELNGRIGLGAHPGVSGGPPVLVELLPNPTLGPEKLVAYELGYRVAPLSRLTIDVASFLNRYSSEIANLPGTPQFAALPPPYHILYPWYQKNVSDIAAHGVEISAHWQIEAHWQVTAGYTWLQLNATNAPLLERGSPKQQFQVRSYGELPFALELNAALYYTDAVTEPAGPGNAAIPPYCRADAGLVWKRGSSLSLGLWGQNLVRRQHVEFADEVFSGLSEVPREVLAKITWGF